MNISKSRASSDLISMDLEDLEKIEVMMEVSAENETKSEVASYDVLKGEIKAEDVESADAALQMTAFLYPKKF